MRQGLQTRVLALAPACLHTHGLWMYPSLAHRRWFRRYGGPYIVSPHGMLSPWALNHSRLCKQVAWWLGQHRVLCAAACFHATAPSEVEDIRRLGFRQPVAVVPLAVDLFDATCPRSADVPRRLLFLSRLHPKKGIDLLLRAWGHLQDHFVDWELVVAGPDEGDHLQFLTRVAEDLRLRRVSFPGPVFDDAKSRLYRSSQLFVLPTLSENFGLVVAEAMAHGLPVITTTGAPWSGLTSRACGWWIEPTTDALTETLVDAMCRSDEDRRAMGERGRRWMEEEFAWPQVAREMRGVYDWLLGRSARPACVLTD